MLAFTTTWFSKINNLNDCRNSKPSSRSQSAKIGPQLDCDVNDLLYEDAEEREVKGSDYLRPFARIQEVIAAVAATEATSTVEGDVARS